MSDFQLGAHDAQIKALLAGQAEMACSITQMGAELHEINVRLAERRGERRAVIWMSGAAGGIAGFLLPILLRAVGIDIGT